MKKALLTAIAFCFTAFLAFFSPAFAQTTVVVPNVLENIQGQGGNYVLFNCGISGFNSMRYQQVYLRSQFPPQASLIDKISFRLEDPGPGFGPTTFPDVQIQLSTTEKQPNFLSNTFADNIGPDVQTVFSGNLTLSAADCNVPPFQPCPFDIMIPLQNPFYYDPQNGNLLLDVRIPVCGETPDFEEAGGLGIDFMSKAYSTDVDSPAATVNFPDDNGLTTQFHLSPPPPQFITLSPGAATNDVLTEHTVTATVFTNGLPDPGELVTFEVVSGPNAGETSDPGSGECTPNDDCTTDASGQVSWTYTGLGGPGTDKIEASFVDLTDAVIESPPVRKMWVGPIPTLSEWGLIAMAGILGIAGYMVMRRRNVRV